MPQEMCNASFISKYVIKPIRLLDEGEADNMAPFVKMWLDDGDEDNPRITVGNESCPGCTPQHTAVIKSFEFASSDGEQLRLEILDEQGGDFEQIANQLFKCIEKATAEHKMKVIWGWVGTNCDDTHFYWPSPILTFLPINIEVNYSQGAIKYTITASDAMQPIFTSRKTYNYGTERHRRRLKQVLPEMFDDREPKVKLLRARRRGKTMLYGDAAYTWKDADEVGTAWTSDGQNKLGVCMKWTENFRTIHDKGTVPFWKTGEGVPTICLLEAGGQDCISDPVEMEARSVGTFIVNAGRCSNVLDFTPQINWVAAFAQLATGGQPATGLSGKGETRDNTRPSGCEDLQSKETGLGQNLAQTRQTLEINGPKNAMLETQKSQKENEKANNITQMVHPIQAELRIRGNPSPEFCIYHEKTARTCAIVAINPFHLTRAVKTHSHSCPEWLARPAANPVLSNRFWWIFGVNHTIREGSFVTNLKVRLDAPGIDLNPGEPQGGDPISASGQVGSKSPKWTSNAC